MSSCGKGNWVFARNAGVIGWKCNTCKTWVKNFSVFSCECDKKHADKKEASFAQTHKGFGKTFC